MLQMPKPTSFGKTQARPFFVGTSPPLLQDLVLIVMSAAPMMLELEFARVEQAEDPYAFQFVPQDYLLRTSGGGFERARLVWDIKLIADLDAVRQSGRDPVVLSRIGETLRRFVWPLGWQKHGEQILEASRQGQRVYLTIRSAAAELYALPWELLMLSKGSGQHVGAMPGVLLRYEWPETTTTPMPTSPEASCERTLLVWSAAGGAVPAAEHVRALEEACRGGAHPFVRERDVLPHVSIGRLRATLEAAKRDSLPISTLHVVAHGGAAGATFGLVFNGDSADSSAVTIHAGQLQQLLAPYTGMIRLVLLIACDSSNVGALGNQLGSVAQKLHRAGIASVVASRCPLSVTGSIRLVEALYQGLLVHRESLESAFLVARERLADDAAQVDWASLQIYARAADGQDTRPFIARPRTVIAPSSTDWTNLLRDAKVLEQLSRFRNLFSSASEQIAMLTRYKTLHDRFQELEVPYKVLLRDRKRLAGSMEAWDEVHEFLAGTRERIRAIEWVLESPSLRTEFAMCKQQLSEARRGLEIAEEEADAQKLNRALKHLKESLARYPSKANDRLMALVQSLPLVNVIEALRSMHSRLSPSAPDSGALLVMGQKVAALDALHHKLVTLVDEHNQWQGIDNELRVIADSPTGANREAIESSWPLVRGNVAELLKSVGDAAPWAVELRKRGNELDAAIAASGQVDEERGAKRLRQSFGDYFRSSTARFEDVDKMLLKTCEDLQQEGQTLDSVLGVLDEKQ